MAWEKLLSTKNTGQTVNGMIEFAPPISANTEGGGFIFYGVTDSAQMYYIEPTLNDDGRLRIHMQDNDNDPVEFVWNLWRADGELHDQIIHRFDCNGYVLGAPSDKSVGDIKPAVSGQGRIGTPEARFESGYFISVYTNSIGNSGNGSLVINSDNLLSNGDNRTTRLGINWRNWDESFIKDMYGKSLIFDAEHFSDVGSIWYIDTDGTWYQRFYTNKNCIQLKGGTDSTKYLQLSNDVMEFTGAIISHSLKAGKICIQTDASGYTDTSRSSEINNFESHLYLQHATSNNIIACMGGGNFGISTDNPGFKLDVNGECGATAFYQQSDINLKTNIIDVDINKAKYVIENTRPVEFDWKKDGKHSQGVIAQEAEKVIPESVEHGSEYLSVNYNAYIPYLIKMVQEQQKQIEELQKEIQELKKETPTK